MIWDWGDDLNRYVSDLTAPVDTIVLGRKLARGFIPTWTSHLENSQTADAGARKMVETRKVVFTQTLAESDWAMTELAKGDLVEEITRLKSEQGQDIITYGGGTFVSSLIAHGLIDEYHLFVNPAVLGDGMSIFKGVHYKQGLTLVKSMAFDCGIVLLQYEPV